MQKNRKTLSLLLFMAMVSLACLLLFVPETFAEEISTGRKIWNNVMMWVNFGILVFLFMRYAKKPLVGYLKSVRSTTKKNIDETRSELDSVQSKMTAEEQKMKEVDQRIKEIREAILAIGEQDKEQIIAHAKVSAEKMIEDAKAYAQYRMAMARKALSDEMVDIAIGIAGERIAEGITDEDHEKLVNQFISNLGTVKQAGK